MPSHVLAAGAALMFSMIAEALQPRTLSAAGMPEREYLNLTSLPRKEVWGRG